MENYFNYFTEIEEHFQRRRGNILLLSTMDWALIEVWKDAGIPLEAALRGIDSAFDRYDQRPSKSRKVNSLAYCAQAVLSAAEEMKEATVGAASPEAPKREQPGFSNADIAAFLQKNAGKLQSAQLPEGTGISGNAVAQQVAETLRGIAEEVEACAAPARLEDLERRLTVLEEKLFAVLLAATPDGQIVEVRAQADRDLAPYRSKMPSAQVEQLQKQYLHKRLLEKYELPRLSLFYM